MLRSWKFQVQLDDKSDKPLYLQIADSLIRDIRLGRLQQGDALPGSRSMSQVLKVNRNTVVEALNVLLTEGWLVSIERKGTFVAGSPSSPAKVRNPKRQDAATALPPHEHYRIRFDDGHPDSRIAPVKELARAYRQIFNLKARWQLMGYGDASGDIAFRRELSRMLNHQRGLQTREDHICVTRGSQMAMYLLAHSLFSPGDNVIVEHPGYKPAWAAFESAGAKLHPVKVDEEGLVTGDVIACLASGKKIKAVYVTPHRQYPTTVTLSLARRLELVRLSNEYGFVLIEDDYDHEFHFGYRPALPLSSFPGLNAYVYIGTMSKVVAPALRIGYLVTKDSALLKKACALRKIVDVQGDNIMEQAVLQLIKDGTVRRHISKATRHYKSKRDFTAALLEQYLGPKVTFTLPEGGLAFWIVPVNRVKWSKVDKGLRRQGIKMIAPGAYSYEEDVDGLRFGYGALSESQIAEALAALAALI